MTDITIRINVRDKTGKTSDAQLDFGLESFAGIIPSIGDTVVDPGVLQDLDRHKPENRTVWKVVDRVFNPKDQQSYVALIVEERNGTEADPWL